MKLSLIVAFAASLLAGCGISAPKKDYFDNRHTMVGSDIPVRRGHLTDDPVSINAPAESVGRNRPSLYPVDPIGRGNRND